MPLQFAHLAPRVWSALENLPRSGWIKVGIEDPETTAEHTQALLVLAREFAPRISEFSAQDREELLAMLEVHDWPEAETGDEITLYGVDSAEKEMRKYERESRAMQGICALLGEMGARMLALWIRFEAGNDPVARFARALDKYQAIEQAFKYEREGKGPKGLGDEFVRYSPPIEHPLLKERFKKYCTLLI